MIFDINLRVCLCFLSFSLLLSLSDVPREKTEASFNHIFSGSVVLIRRERGAYQDPGSKQNDLGSNSRLLALFLIRVYSLPLIYTNWQSLLYTWTQRWWGRLLAVFTDILSVLSAWTVRIWGGCCTEPYLIVQHQKSTKWQGVLWFNLLSLVLSLCYLPVLQPKKMQQGIKHGIEVLNCSCMDSSVCMQPCLTKITFLLGCRNNMLISINHGENNALKNNTDKLRSVV